MAKRETPKASNLIFSYVPLLVGQAGVSYVGDEAVQTAEVMSEFMEKLPSGAAMACLWMMEEDGTPCAVFAMDACDDIADHLKYWSEGKPEDWFAFHYLEKGPSYAIALMPNFRRSSERWKIAFQLRHGYPPIEGSETHVFRPLHCVALTKTAFDQVKKHLGPKVKVGLVGKDEITRENYRVTEEQIRWLGSFKVVREDSKKGLAGGYLESSIDDMLKEEAVSRKRLG